MIKSKVTGVQYAGMNISGTISVKGIESRTQFHENVLARTVLNDEQFSMDDQKGHISDLCFHYTLDQPLVKR